MFPLLPMLLDDADVAPCQDPTVGSGVALIRELERGGGLTAHQARLLRESWPNLAEDWASNPYFGTVREHTRAYIDRLARNEAGAFR